MMQYCPKFDKTEIDHMKAVLARAKNASVQQHRSAVYKDQSTQGYAYRWER